MRHVLIWVPTFRYCYSIRPILKGASLYILIWVASSVSCSEVWLSTRLTQVRLVSMISIFFSRIQIISMISFLKRGITSISGIHKFTAPNLSYFFLVITSLWKTRPRAWVLYEGSRWCFHLNFLWTFSYGWKWMCVNLLHI